MSKDVRPSSPNSGERSHTEEESASQTRGSHNSRNATSYTAVNQKTRKELARNGGGFKNLLPGITCSVDLPNLFCPIDQENSVPFDQSKISFPLFCPYNDYEIRFGPVRPLPPTNYDPFGTGPPMVPPIRPRRPYEFMPQSSQTNNAYDEFNQPFTHYAAVQSANGQPPFVTPKHLTSYVNPHYCPKKVDEPLTVEQKLNLKFHKGKAPLSGIDLVFDITTGRRFHFVNTNKRGLILILMKKGE